MNERTEIAIMNHVKFNYDKFPEGELTKSESPDFLLQAANGKTIGIELTEIFKDLQEGGSKLKEREIFKNKINNEVIEQVKEKYPTGYCIDIDFKRDFTVKQNQYKGLIKRLTDDVLKEIPSLVSNFDHTHMDNIDLDPLSAEWRSFKKQAMADGYRIFHPGVTHIAISRFDDIQTFYTYGGGGIVPPLTAEALKFSLATKEKKLSDFRNCDEHWLVIAEGLDFSGYFNDVAVDLPIESKFNRVLLYRDVHKTVIELKNVPY